MPDRLIIFTRYPRPGNVKTRLIPAIGPEGAAQLHTALTRRTLQTTEQFCRHAAFELDVRVADGDLSDMRSLYGDEVPFAHQSGADLGERLHDAVTRALDSGARRVLVVDTDCPELAPAILNQAANALESTDVVIGPALDGGYYLIGLRAASPELFQTIAWGTGAVLAQTLAAAARLGLRVHQLSPLSDIDEPQDLLVWRRVAGALPGTPAAIHSNSVSIVIPALNEADVITTTIRPLLGMPNVEVIVADGGSTDRTAEIAHDLGVRVVVSRRGRGRQMNAGAAVADGARLLFLHADTRLPPDFVAHVDAVLSPVECAGAFRLRIDGDSRALRWLEWGANDR